MKKSDPSSHVADQASLSKAQAGDVVDAVFSAIADASDTAPPSDNEPPRDFRRLFFLSHAASVVCSLWR